MLFYSIAQYNLAEILVIFTLQRDWVSGESNSRKHLRACTSIGKTFSYSLAFDQLNYLIRFANGFTTLSWPTNFILASCVL